MAKISKTYTIEEETMKIVKENKENRNLSSDSDSLERIVLEWAVLKGNNSGLSNIDIDKIVDKVLEKLNINGKNIYNEIEEVEEKTDYENSINDMISDMPD